MKKIGLEELAIMLASAAPPECVIFEGHRMRRVEGRGWFDEGVASAEDKRKYVTLEVEKCFLLAKK